MMPMQGGILNWPGGRGTVDGAVYLFKATVIIDIETKRLNILEEFMDDNLWEMILQNLTNNPRDLQTINKTKRPGIWFYAEVNGETIHVQKARNHRPSSNFKYNHILRKKDFDLMYPIYLRRQNGEEVSNESKISFNRVYIYSIIFNCTKSNAKASVTGD